MESMDKVHFSRCLRFPYPDKLFTFSYFYDEEEDTFVPDKSHVTGTPSHNAYFRYWDVDVSVLRHLRKRCSLLDNFELSGNPSITDEFLEALVLHFPHISSLTISDCSSISLRGIRALLRLASLTHLDVAGLACVDDDCIAMLTDILSSIQDLDISRCGNVSNASLVTLAGCRGCKVLTHLSIAGNPNITHRGTTQLLMYCTNLLHLDVSQCFNLEFLGVVVQIGEGMKQYASAKLRALNVAHCPLNADSIAWISAALPDLETLDVRNVSGINNSSLQSILLGCSSLRILYSQHCKVTSTAAHVLSTAKCSATLTSLDLTGIVKLKGKVLRDILCKTKLVELHVSGVKGITDSAFTDLPPLSLKIVNIAGCAVTANGILSLVENAPHLQSLNLAQLSSLEDSALLCISQHCDGLKHLDITDCLKLSDTGMTRIAQCCYRLVDLRMGTSVMKTNSWGGRVTQYSDTSLKTILANCSKLKVLDIHNQCGIVLTDPWFQKGIFHHAYYRAY